MQRLQSLCESHMTKINMGILLSLLIVLFLARQCYQHVWLVISSDNRVALDIEIAIGVAMLALVLAVTLHFLLGYC